MDITKTSRVYDVWSKIYDRTFGPFLARGQARAIEQMRLCAGANVLDLGVGTGMQLDHYPRDVMVVGLDLSAGMLTKAVGKCRLFRLDHCHLVRGDATRPPFRPATFDHIILSHTISVVSDPVALLRRARTLLKPGGRIVLINHFLSTNRLMAWIEKALNPLFIRLGWRSDISVEEILDGVNLTVEYGFKMRLFSIWQILVLTARTGRKPPQPWPDQAGAAMPTVSLRNGQWAFDTGD